MLRQRVGLERLREVVSAFGGDFIVVWAVRSVRTVTRGEAEGQRYGEVV